MLTILAPEQPHPTLTMAELQEMLLRTAPKLLWDTLQANKQYLPRLSISELKAEKNIRHWQAGEIMVGMVETNPAHYHYLLIK